MKIIDEKGRIFGKINIIDFLAVLLLFFILPMFYFGYRIFTRPAFIIDKRVFKDSDIIIPLDLYAIFRNLDPEIVKMISVGDKELITGGIAIAEVLEVIKIEPNFVSIHLDEEQVITKEDSRRKQATLKINLLGKLEGSDILYNDKKVKVGSDITLKTAKYEIRGRVIPEPVEFDLVSRPGFSPITMDVVFKYLNPEVASLVSLGDFEADKSGETIAKVIRVGQVEPYTYKVDMGGGNYITKVDPQKKQVQAKLEVIGGLHGNAFYFRGERIALDSEIIFNTYKYKIAGVVIREATPIESSARVPITLDVVFKNLNPEVASLVSLGDFEADKSGETIAKVIRVGQVEPYTYKVDMGGGNYITKVDPQKKQVQAKLEVIGGLHGNAFYFRGERIALDSEIIFNTHKYHKLTAMIIREPLTQKKIEKKWVSLKVKFNNLSPEVANIIKNGDEERNTSEELIAKIDSVVSVEPVKSKTIDFVNNELTINDNFPNKDVVLSISVNAVKSQKNLYFKETALKIGNALSLQMKDYDISGRITAIAEDSS